MLKNGDIVGDHLILETKGKGSFAYVYKVRNRTSTDMFALKLCISLNVNDMNLFRDENQILQTLSPHKNIITPHSAPLSHTTSHLYYLMELANFQLEQLLTTTKTTITDEEKIRIFAEICEGLHYAHSNNVIHRDLHWGNVLVVQSDGIKISDFGLGKSFDSTRFGNSIQPRWGYFVCPPEHYFKIYDNATSITNFIPGDIYALGIILYYLFDNPPIGYVTEMNNHIQDFLINKENISIDTVDIHTRVNSYERWTKIVTTYNKLEIFSLNSNSANSKVNEIIRKATHPNHNLRYQSVSELIAEVQNIFI